MDMNITKLAGHLRGLEHEAWIRMSAMGSLERKTGDYEWTVERIKAEAQLELIGQLLALVTVNA